MRIFIMATVALTLAGCASDAQRLERISGRCSLYGFQRGTPEFAQCVQTADENERAAHNAQSQQIIRDMGSAYQTPGVTRTDCRAVGADRLTCVSR